MFLLSDRQLIFVMLLLSVYFVGRPFLGWAGFRTNWVVYFCRFANRCCFFDSFSLSAFSARTGDIMRAARGGAGYCAGLSCFSLSTEVSVADLDVERFLGRESSELIEAWRLRL